MTVQEIERAIGALTSKEFEELRQWIEQYASLSQPIDVQLQADLEEGRTDRLIDQAVENHRAEHTIPL